MILSVFQIQHAVTTSHLSIMDPKGDRLRLIKSGQLKLPESVLKVRFDPLVLQCRRNHTLAELLTCLTE